MSSLRVDPVPSDEEAAAIAAAHEALWPRPVVESTDDRTPPWRFSGRWWNQSHPVLRRGR